MANQFHAGGAGVFAEVVNDKVKLGLLPSKGIPHHQFLSY